MDEAVRKYVDAMAKGDEVRTVAEPLARAIQAPLLPYLAGVETLVIAG